MLGLVSPQAPPDSEEPGVCDEGLGGRGGLGEGRRRGS